MNHFIELIEERNITAFGLIIKSIRTIIQNLGGIILAMLLYFLIFAFISTVFNTIGFETNSKDTLISSMQTFLFGLLTAVAGNYILVKVYYHLLKDDGTHESSSFYAIKKTKLYLTVNLFLFILSLLIVIPLVIVGIAVPFSLFGGFFGVILFIVVAFILFIFMFTLNGINIEYILTDQTIFESVGNALNIVSTYILDILKKAIGLALFYAVIFLIVDEILSLTLVNASNAVMYTKFGNAELLLDYLITGNTAVTVLIVVALILIATFMLAMHYVSITGYYLNLNNYEGYEIIGLSREAKLKNKQINKTK